ncbi:hypothetical protein B0T10DRAFT_611926 [Thelonectria olida]|uniref:Zn(2)-C6 fungal-type domain-containing protein n=1 Tax=Thelonectria olida TaxID=1576542 RepID=A0A9P9AG63_9HYPO|nr:hypothetical protein B0T10DRAFT_611926 [Thelonectria olida]
MGANTEVNQPHGQDNSARTTVACQRCRDQKLRCNRELPSCTRCDKQKATCKYPNPPDRRRIALRTGQAKALALNGGEQAETTVKLGKRQRVVSDLTDSASSSARPNPDPISSPASAVTEGADLPPSEVGLLLLEVYFKRVYNASLLFHKSIAFQLYRQNAIPDYLLRAIFAQAAVFMQQVDSPYKQYIDIFPFHSIFEKSWSWARSASQEVLSHVDEPTLVRVQALQVLHLYYFSRGSIQRAMVHASLAYQLCQVLGYHQLHNDTALMTTSRGLQLDQEMKRRCFWASWACLCMGGCKSDYGTTLEGLKGLPLPVRFEKTGSVQGVELKLRQKIGVGWEPSGSSAPPSHGLLSCKSPCSLMAELVKLLDVWSQVKTFITESPRRPSPQRTNQLEKLMDLFLPLQSSLGLSFGDICDRAESYNESPELLMSLCSMYHLSRLLLHASMVPILSGYPPDPADAGSSVQTHTEAALQQATGFVKLLQQFVAKGLDITRLWHFTGYGAFVVGRIFVVYRGKSQASRSADQLFQIPGLDSEEMKTIQTVLEVLSIYWEPLRELSTVLKETISTGRYIDLDSITSPSFSWERRRSGSVSEDYDDTISVPNNPSTNVALFKTPAVRLLSEGQQFQDMIRHEESTESRQSLPEQQVPSSQTAAGSDGSAQQSSDAGPQFQDYPMANGHEGGLFDVNWWDASTINIWGHAAASWAEMPPDDPVVFF